MYSTQSSGCHACGSIGRILYALDDEVPVSVELHEGAAADRTPLFVTENLPSGPHTLKITNDGVALVLAYFKIAVDETSSLLRTSANANTSLPATPALLHAARAETSPTLYPTASIFNKPDKVRALSGGVVAGIIAGSVAGAVLLIGGPVFIWILRRRGDRIQRLRIESGACSC